MYLQYIVERGTGLLERRFHHFEGVAGLLLDIPRRRTPLRIPASDAVEEQQVAGADRAAHSLLFRVPCVFGLRSRDATRQQRRARRSPHLPSGFHEIITPSGTVRAPLSARRRPRSHVGSIRFILALSLLVAAEQAAAGASQLYTDRDMRTL